MGFFSWQTADTKRSISNKYSSRGTFPVFVLLPEGGFIAEDNYEGYGVFGGQDIYALLAQWNAPELCTGDPEHDRGIGIDLQYSRSSQAIKYPIKIVENMYILYPDAAASENCELQGYFYSDDYEDEED